MTLTYPNIVPENNLRLPDALTIKHGSAPLLSRFVLEGDKAGRQMGIRLRVRYDFEELLYLNKQKVANGTWYPLMRMFNSEYSDLSPENSYWISGEDEHGQIVATHAGRVHYWPSTTLEQEANSMLYGGSDEGPRCVVTAPDAKTITGVVVYGGSAWVRPEFRGQRLSQLVAPYRPGICARSLADRLGDFYCRTCARREGGCRRLWLQAHQLQHYLSRSALGGRRKRFGQCLCYRSLRRLR
jgi:hypothetical protein